MRDLESIKKKWKLFSSFILTFVFFPIIGMFILLYNFFKKACKRFLKWAKKPSNASKYRG